MMSFDKSATYCFIEGKDWSYYFSIYSSQGIKNLTPISCYGKANVVKVRELIKKHNDENIRNTFFLVDKDYSEDSSESDLYVTPCYSIESFYASTEMVRHFSLTELRYSGGDFISLEDISKLKDIFKLRLNDFLNFMIEINTFCYLAKKKHQLCINSIVVKDIVDIKLDKLVVKKNSKDLFNKYLSSHPYDDFFQEFDVLKSEFENEPFKKCRGKFLKQFLVKFLDLIKQDITLNNPTLVSKKCVFSKQISEKNFISDFSPYADKPSCIIEFVKLAAKAL